MNREKLRDHPLWGTFMMLMGIVNVGAMLPQLITIVREENASGVSLLMYLLFFIIQAAFGVNAWAHRDRRFMICMLMAMTVTAAIIVSIICYRP